MGYVHQKIEWVDVVVMVVFIILTCSLRELDDW
jgi:hypothetical protein